MPRSSTAVFSPLFTEIAKLLMQRFRAEGSELRFVGGAVRDCLLGRCPNDIDFSTPALPGDVIRLIQQAGLTAIPSGIQFGTITAYDERTKRKFEITTLRRDVRTNGRYASVEFTKRWDEDAARRDLTINALYCDDRGRLYDFFDGETDLAEGRIHFIGDPQDRISEDYLRILRYFRFWCLFGRKPPEPELLRLLEKKSQHLHILSGERIWRELRGILMSPRFSEACWMMRRILAPFLGTSYLHPPSYDFWDHSLLQDPLLRLSVLLPSDTAYRAVKARLHLSNSEATKLHSLCCYETYDVRNSEERLRRALEIPQQDLHLQCLATDVVQAVLKGFVAEEEAVPLLDKIAATVFPIFPLKGEDLLRVGIPAGPIMGRILKETHAWWIKKNGLPTREECLKLTKKMHQEIA
jgi:poly(A) polymerase